MRRTTILVPGASFNRVTFVEGVGRKRGITSSCRPANSGPLGVSTISGDPISRFGRYVIMVICPDSYYMRCNYVMLCYVMWCYVMWCYVVVCDVMLCYVMLCHVLICMSITYIWIKSIKTEGPLKQKKINLRSFGQMISGKLNSPTWISLKFSGVPFLWLPFWGEVNVTLRTAWTPRNDAQLVANTQKCDNSRANRASKTWGNGRTDMAKWRGQDI